jgi:transcriptional regulator with XRE-family HTH domain
MSVFPKFCVQLPGTNPEALILSQGAWSLLQKFQNWKHEKRTNVEIAEYLLALRKKKNLSREKLVAKGASLGIRCTIHQIEYWEKSPSVMDKLVLASQLFNTTPLTIVMEAMGWDFSDEEVAEVTGVYIAFGQRLSPNGHKNLRQLNAQNKKLDSEIDLAIQRERQRQSLS